MKEYEVEIVHTLTVTQRRRVNADSFRDAEVIAEDLWKILPDERVDGCNVYCHVDRSVRKFYTRQVGTKMARRHRVRSISWQQLSKY